MRDEKKQWPVLLVSGQFGMENDDAFRLRELAAELEQAQECASSRPIRMRTRLRFSCRAPTSDA